MASFEGTLAEGTAFTYCGIHTCWHAEQACIVALAFATGHTLTNSDARRANLIIQVPMHPQKTSPALWIFYW